MFSTSATLKFIGYGKARRPLAEPVPLRSIINETLKSPEALNRIVGDQNEFGELTTQGRAALGLFPFSRPPVSAEPSREMIHHESVHF
jgi:hypothetical protein